MILGGGAFKSQKELRLLKAYTLKISYRQLDLNPSLITVEQRGCPPEIIHMEEIRSLLTQDGKTI